MRLRFPLKKRRISWLAERLTVSQTRLCCMELGDYIIVSPMPYMIRGFTEIIFWCSELWHRVVWKVGTNVSEAHTGSIFKIPKKRQCAPSKRCPPVKTIRYNNPEVVSYPCNRPWRPIGLWEVEALTFSRQSTHRWRKVVSLTRRPPFIPQEDSWYSLLLETESTPGPLCGWKD
jgi:hypothetical protein